MERQSLEQEQIKFIAVLLLILISFLGTIGNLLVLKAIFSLRKRKLHEYLILNLATTDAGTCLVSIPLDIAEQLIGRFPYGAALCRIIYPLQSVLVYVSVLTLLFMSVERYRLIVTPMKSRIRVKTGMIAIVVMWILSCLIVLPFALALTFTGTECSEEWSHTYSGQVFTLTIFAFLFVIPLFLMTVFYAFMIRVLYKDSKAVKRGSRFSLSQASIDQRLHRNVKIVKVFALAVVAFALCMLPTHITWLWHDFGQGSSRPELFSRVLTFSNIFMYANSLIDPFIFGSIDVKTLAKCFRVLVCCRSGGQESRRSFEHVFSLRIRTPSMSKQFAHGTFFRSLSKASELSQRNINTRNAKVNSVVEI